MYEFIEYVNSLIIRIHVIFFIIFKSSKLCFVTQLPPKFPKKKICGHKKTKADDHDCQQMMKRKRLLDILDANDPNYVPEKSYLRHPPPKNATTSSKSNYGSDADDPDYVPEECNLKNPPETNAITNLKSQMIVLLIRW
jgi:hypothetical protein